MIDLSPLKRLLPGGGDGPLVPVVRLKGAIGMGGRLASGFDFAAVSGALEKAFSVKKAPAVALVINSPGGSPVQSSLIYQRICALKAEKEKKVFVFVEDAAASGGYYIACAGDEIYCDASSIVGSIGVISAGFGFPDALAKLGIERRVHAAGENKSVLDPFLPEKSEDVERLKELQLDIHQVFKQVVRASRGDKLDETDKELFTGAFWTGSRAVKLGLADGIGEVRTILRGVYGEKTRLKVIPTVAKSKIQRMLGLKGPGALEHFGAELAGGLVSAADERALWTRLGL